MGCKSSRPKEQAPITISPNHVVVGEKERVSEAVSSFFRVVNEQNDPMARRILEDWSIFVSALTNFFDTNDETELTAVSKKETDSWLVGPRGETIPYGHREADAVGKSFLAFLRDDLSSRGWGGSFDYAVSGREEQGYLKVAAVVERIPANRSAVHVANFDRKINYVVLTQAGAAAAPAVSTN